MAEPARKKAVYADLEALAPNLVGEILFGVLHVFPRPRTRHARASTRLTGRLGPELERAGVAGNGQKRPLSYGDYILDKATDRFDGETA